MSLTTRPRCAIVDKPYDLPKLQGKDNSVSTYLRDLTVVALVASASHFARAAEFDPAATQCAGGHDDIIPRLLAEVEFANNALPNVPPEEARYLEAEMKAAMRVGAEEYKTNKEQTPMADKRLSTLYSRPLYPVWEFRSNIEPTRLALERVLKLDPASTIYYKNAEAEKLQRALSASSQVATYSRAVERLTTALKGAPIMTAAQYSRLTYNGIVMPTELQFFMTCKLAKVMGKQTLPQ